MGMRLCLTEYGVQQLAGTLAELGKAHQGTSWHPVHLVIPCGRGFKELEKISQSFPAVGIAFGILTRFFETFSEDAERRVDFAFLSFFEDEGIDYIDAVEPMYDLLDSAVTTGEAIYPRYDGHPFQVGYEVYAKAASVLVLGLGSAK